MDKDSGKIITYIYCPDCKGRTNKLGKIPTRHGKIQRYRCTECGRTFYSEVKK